ncbi:MAG: hypothetical protein WAN43_01170 [Rhodomicrobium sp.]
MKALEEEGVVFLEATNAHLPSVAVRIDSPAGKRIQASGSGDAAGEGGLKAAWDDSEPVSAEIGEMRAYWRERPAQWAALSEVGRETLLREMGGFLG